MVFRLKGQRSRFRVIHLFAETYDSKTNDPKVFKLGIENNLRISYNYMVLGLNGHRLGLGCSNNGVGVGSNSMSAF